MTKIAIASDHAGFNLKSALLNLFKDSQYQFIDCGTNSAQNSVDYPDFANLAVEKINNDEADYAILICGSGIGISIAANRHKNIRAALCTSKLSAQLSRQHNDANILCFGANETNIEQAYNMVEIFLNTKFEGGRHIQRIDKLSN